MCNEVCPYCLRIGEWRWMEVQEIVTTVGFELQFNFVVVYYSKGWHHCDLVIVIATYLHSNHCHHQQKQYSVQLCAGNLYVTSNSGCHFQSHLDYKTGTVFQKNQLQNGGICAVSSLLDGLSVFTLLASQYSSKVHFHFMLLYQYNFVMPLLWYKIALLWISLFFCLM